MEMTVTLNMALLSYSLSKIQYLEKPGDNEVASLGEQLGHAFGWRLLTRDNIIPIVERGGAICLAFNIE